jgi:hypothetical protein
MIELAVPQSRGCQARLQALNQRPVTVIGERVLDGRTRAYSPCGGICSVFTDRKEVFPVWTRFGSCPFFPLLLPATPVDARRRPLPATPALAVRALSASIHLTRTPHRLPAVSAYGRAAPESEPGPAPSDGGDSAAAAGGRPEPRDDA